LQAGQGGGEVGEGLGWVAHGEVEGVVEVLEFEGGGLGDCAAWAEDEDGGGRGHCGSVYEDEGASRLCLVVGE